MEFITNHGMDIVKFFTYCLALTLAFWRFRSWMKDEDVKETKKIVKETLIEHCPIAHSTLKTQIEDLKKTVEKNSPNGELKEIKAMVENLTRELTA